jgi:hypothetical protein
MMRLALVLAAAVFGTGCVFVHDDDDNCARSVTVDWAFQTAEGAVIADCATAGVRDIDVWVNGALQATFDCFGPPGTVPVARGANVVTVEGIDTLARIAYRAEVPVPASSCGNQGTIATQPAEGFVVADYSFSPVNACAGSTFITLLVHDDVAVQTAFLEPGVACDVVAAAPRYRLPVGSFTLLGIEEVTSLGATVAADCTDRPFEIGASATTTVQPVLLDSSVACF